MTTTAWRLLYLGAVLDCDFPILEALFHGRPEDNPLDTVANIFKQHNVPFGKISINPDLNVCYGRQGHFIIYQKARCMGTFEITWDKRWKFHITQVGRTDHYHTQGNWIRLLEEALTPQKYPPPMYPYTTIRFRIDL
jgi:hypothetical protein